MNNRDGFVSDSIILAIFFCRTREFDLCGLTIERVFNAYLKLYFSKKNSKRTTLEFQLYSKLDETRKHVQLCRVTEKKVSPTLSPVLV